MVNCSVIITICVSNKNKRDESYFVLKSCSQGLAKTMKRFKLTPNFNEPVQKTNSLTILMSFQ